MDLVLSLALQAPPCRAAVVSARRETADFGRRCLIGSPWVEAGKMPLNTMPALISVRSRRHPALRSILPNYGVVD